MFGRVGDELLNAVKNLGALDKRTEDIAKRIEYLAQRIEVLAERVTRLEAGHDHLKDSVKSAVIAEVKADVVRTQTILDLSSQSLHPRIGRGRASDG